VAALDAVTRATLEKAQARAQAPAFEDEDSKLDNVVALTTGRRYLVFALLPSWRRSSARLAVSQAR
jgi:ribosomal protein S12 methylthiotransferase accessory factor YcaO